MRGGAHSARASLSWSRGHMPKIAFRLAAKKTCVALVNAIDLKNTVSVEMEKVGGVGET